MSKQKIFLLAGGVGLSLLTFGLVFTTLFGGGFEAKEELEVAMRLLDEGRWDVAGRIARELADGSDFESETQSALEYVLGASRVLEVGMELDTPRNRRHLVEATQHLEASASLGFPLGYRGKGKFALGWCYFNTYRWDDVVDTLHNIESLWPQRRSDAYEMIVLAQLHRDPPDFAMAEELIERWISIPGLSASEQERVQLARATREFYMGNYIDCDQLLAEIDEDSAQHASALLWRARLRLQDAQQRSQTDPERSIRLSDADQYLKRLLLSPDTPPAIHRKADFLAGRLLRLQNNRNDAIGTFSAIRQRKPQSAEAIAAALEEAELLLEQNKHDEAIAACQLLLRNIEDLSLYNAYWLSADQLRERLMNIGRSMLESERYEPVILLAEHLALAYPQSDSVRMQAEAFEQWAHRMAESQNASPADIPEDARRRLESTYRAAAVQYERLAALELKSPDYPNLLWHAISNYQRSNDLDEANDLLDEYLTYEEDAKRPRGFLAMGKNYMDAGQWDRAVVPLERCLAEHRGHGILYEVRLLAAKAHAELGDLITATERLEENLLDHGLHPESAIWDNSMYELGQVLFKRGHRIVLELQTPAAQLDGSLRREKLKESQQHFSRSVDRLGLAVSFMDDDPRYYDARYTIARAHRLAADTYQALVTASIDSLESERRKNLQKWRELLTRALKEFRTLRESIVLDENVVAATDRFRDLVRNCYFGEADALYDLEQWDQAVAAYRNAASRYMNQPESLEALVQMAMCYRQQGNAGEARTTLVQAEQVLSRIPSEHDQKFAILTRADRDGWENLLSWLRRWD